MIIKTFRARTMEEALAKVKASLGPSALIIETRKAAPRGLFGFLRNPVVEIVVGVEDTPPTAERRPRALVPISWAAELANLRSVEGEITEVKEALRILTESPPFDLDAAGRDLVRRLVGQGLDRHAATALAQEAEAARKQAGGGNPIDHLRAVLAARFRTADERPAPADGTPHAVTFIGPPGSGKTTLLVKLAGRLALGRGERVVLASMDFFRVGAVEQLKAYAEILGVPFHLVAAADAVPGLLDAARGAQWLLVDTPGLASGNGERLGQLAAWLGALPGNERHLVLNAAAEAQSALEAIEVYRQVGFDRLAFARLDEARRGGLLLAAAEVAGVPVTYLGIGQDVAQRPEVARPARLGLIALDPLAAAPAPPRRRVAEGRRTA